MIRTRTLVVAAAVGTLAACAPVSVKETGGHRWLPATAQKLPRWRGFNLLEKFNVGHCEPFKEEDFRLIAKLGFNFVRLPMDYRCWIKDKDWEQFDEDQLKEIDQVVELGNRYGVHVCLNFHRAPGYTVARPPEPKSLWTDADAQRVCAKHWATFARRYKGIPNERLSFNLFNEPSRIEPQVYFDVCKKIVAAIHAEDPKRLVIADGIEWGGKPVLELRKLKIAQATRGYSPMDISHYQASWVGGENFAAPTWPRPVAFGFMPGPAKQKEGMGGPLVIEGPFAKTAELRLHVMTVSSHATLVVEADGQKVWEHAFKCGPGAGEWTKAEFKEQWKIYQNLYDRDYVVPIAAGTKQLRVSVTEGDWMQLRELGIKPAGAGAHEDTLALNSGHNDKPGPLRYTPGAAGCAFVTDTMEDRDWLWRTRIEPWKEAEAKGTGVIVGEWGAFNKTPHEVVLRWMEDCLKNWKQAGWGWAMWNFRGSFGVFDSGRADVAYEDFEGHQLDRKMLELLQRY